MSKKKHKKPRADKRAEAYGQEVWSYSFSVGVLLLAVTAAIAGSQKLERWEITIFQNINNLSDVWRPFWLIVTQFGSVWMLILAVFAAWLYKSRKLATDLFLHGFITYILVQIGKQIIARPRPDILLSVTQQRELFIGPQYGFPSGHTAIATAVGLTLLPYLPKNWRWIVPVWVILVAVSRVYLGVHTALDIIGGFALGSIVAAMGRIVTARRISKAGN